MSANSNHPSRLLIIGVGSIGERHLRCFQQTGRAELVICEPNAELGSGVAAHYKVQSHASLNDALNAGHYNGVVICTPAHLHVSIAQACLEAGAAALIEKPLSTSADGIDDLLRLRDERRLATGVAYVLRFSPALQQARTCLREGTIGAPLHASIVSGQHFPTFRPSYRNTYYACHESGGGAIQDALTHNAHSVEWLLGPTESLFCDAAHQALAGVEVEDTVNVLARNGTVLVNYSLNQFQAPNEQTILIHGEKGSIQIQFHRQRWGFLLHGDEDWNWHNTPVNDRDTLFIAQANAFLDAMEGKETELCSLEEGIQTLKFNLAALESARCGRKITL